MIRKIVMVVLAVLALGMFGLTGVAWRQQAALNQTLDVSEVLLLDVQPGDTPGGLFRRLEAEGRLQGAFWLRLYWRLNLADRTLHSGEYRLEPGMRVRDLLAAWLDGKVVQYSLTLVEGWNFRQVRAALARDARLNQTLQGLTDEQVMSELGYAGQHPEGRFFPDTYLFTRGTSDRDLLRQAYERLDRVLNEEWARREEGLPYQDAYQALIMASIIEKETGVPHERAEIAGVFVRRLQRGMLLQTDPTVIYGLGEAYAGRITRAHLRQPTPYNTYTNAGLPPTPIAMVGREAIHAALHPAAGTSLFFVARGDGSHVFSDDLNQHNQAVRRYQLNRRADYRSSPAPAPAPSNDAEVSP